MVSESSFPLSRRQFSFHIVVDNISFVINHNSFINEIFRYVGYREQKAVSIWRNEL